MGEYSRIPPPQINNNNNNYARIHIVNSSSSSSALSFFVGESIFPVPLYRKMAIKRTKATGILSVHRIIFLLLLRSVLLFFYWTSINPDISPSSFFSRYPSNEKNNIATKLFSMRISFSPACKMSINPRTSFSRLKPAQKS